MFIGLTHRGLADVFVVTSNADVGAGTLREALISAAANGSTIQDRIEFNLPDLSEAGRTIKLLSQLPDISSNLIIDGSTQPGAKFGVSDAKIGLFYQPSIVQDLSGLKVFEQHDVKIFGLYIKYIRDPNQTWYYNWMGLEITNGNNIQIGDVGKGNIVSGFSNPLSVNESTPPGGILRWYLQDLTIKANIFGLESDGKTFSQNSDGISTLRSVLGQIIIEGNVFFKGLSIRQNNGYDVPSPYAEAYQTLPADIQIRDNKIGVNYNASSSSFGTFGLILVTSGSLGKNTYHIEDNIINSESFNAIDISNNAAPIYILRNYIGVDKSLQNHFRTGGININAALQVQIGDSNPANGNYIAHGKPVSITSSQANFPNKVTVNKNSFFCTEDAYPMYLRTEGVFIPVVSILSISPTSAKGTATPNSSIELFYSDLCGTCSPETYFASVIADANGNWEYNGPILRTVIASATINGNTSEFTLLNIDVSSIKVINACNGLGSITGVVPKNATGFKWVDENGNTVATTADLLNVPVGKYKMVAQNGTCSAESIYFQIVDALKINSAVVQIKNSSCNNADGAVTGLTVTNSTSGQVKYSWKNGGGAEVGTALDLKNIVAGIYTFTVTTVDGSCTQTYGPVTIQNTTGPNIDQSQVNITPTNCGQSIGSITGITATGSGTIVYTWKNAQQQIVGTTANLLNQPAGVYTLEVKDGGACGPIFSSAITISEVNGITMDESTAQTILVSCGTNGGVKSIKVVGATQYQWTNSLNEVVATTLDLINVVPGDYKLIASNAFGCSKISNVYRVDMAPPTLYPIYGHTDVHNCFGQTNSGSITINTDAMVKALRWVNDRNETIGTSSTISNLASGTYQLYLTNQAGCEKLYASYMIATRPQLQIEAGKEKIMNDECSLKKGSISNIEITGGFAPYTYTWLDAGNKVISTSLALSGLGEGTYTLQVNDSRGCGMATATYNIQNQTSVIPAPIANDVKLCSAGNVTLTVNNITSIYGYRLYDTYTSVTPLADEKTGKFNVNVNSSKSYYISQYAGQCESARTEVKIIVGISSLDIANTFTPNGDGVNDSWKIKGIENAPSATVQVFNRSGQKVFESKGYSQPFDGTMNNQQLATGVYFYVINMGTACNIITGSLTIIR